MKKILVPTDFSENAHNAFITALNLSRLFKAEVILLSVYDQPHTGQSILRDLSAQLSDTAKDDLQQELEVVQSQFSDIKVLPKVVKGSTAETIHRVAEIENANLIVMGKTGRSGFSNKIFGSVALEVIDKTDRAVLLVPQCWTYKEITKICLASDFSAMNYQEVLQPLIPFARHLHAPVDIIHFTTDTDDLQAVLDEKPKEKEEIATALKQIPHYFVFGVREDVQKALADFIDTRDFHMMCMIKHEYPWIQKIFQPSPTIEAAIHTKVPLLILR